MGPPPAAPATRNVATATVAAMQTDQQYRRHHHQQQYRHNSYPRFIRQGRQIPSAQMPLANSEKGKIDEVPLTINDPTAEEEEDEEEQDNNHSSSAFCDSIADDDDEDVESGGGDKLDGKLRRRSASSSARNNNNHRCLLMAKARLFAVVLSIGAGSMFLVSLDSVVDNLIPVARDYLIQMYGSETKADLAWSWVVSARVYGLAVGCLCAFMLSNWHSRKWPLIGSFLINLVGGALAAMICVPVCGVQIACLGRFLGGIGSGLSHILGAAMLAEIPPLRLRGTALASLTVWACAGELFGMFLSLDTILGTPDWWPLALGFPVLIIPFALALLLAAPDSPRALLMAGREQEALDALQYYQKPDDWLLSLKDFRLEMAATAAASSSDDAIQQREQQQQQHKLRHQQQCGKKNARIGAAKQLLLLPIVVVHKKMDGNNNGGMGSSAMDEQFGGLPLSLWPPQQQKWPRQQQSKVTTCCTIKDRFGSGKFVRPLLLATFVLTFAHMDDWLWISYSTQAFSNAGVPTAQAQRASLWMSIPQALISLALLCCFDACSRRRLLIVPTLASIGCAFTAVCMTTGFGGGGGGHTNNDADADSVQLALLNTEANNAAGGFSYSLPLVAALDLCAAAIASESAYTVVPELFAQRDRLMGTALVGIAQNIFGGLLTTCALPLMNVHGLHCVLLPFMLINVLYVLVIARALPETSGKPFHEIADHFPDHLPAAFTNPVRWFAAMPKMLFRALIRKKRVGSICRKRSIGSAGAAFKLATAF